MENMMDEDGENQALRSFLLLYSGGVQTYGNCRCMRLGGYEYAIPEWAKESPASAHVTKAAAQEWIRFILSLEK